MSNTHGQEMYVQGLSRGHAVVALNAVSTHSFALIFGDTDPGDRSEIEGQYCGGENGNQISE